MSFAIVIPTLDEEAVLAETLDRVRLHLRAAAGDFLVVTDGGSRDRTVDLARAAGAQVVVGPPGRGGQLARGARHALERGASALLFLHADTRLPEGARDRVLACLEQGAAGGGFLVSFAPATPSLRLGARLVAARTRWLQVPLGDQAQFAGAEAYARSGGFPDWPLLEDVELLRRLKRVGRLAIVELPVETSSRRFARRGVVRTVTTNWLIWGLYAAGVRPRTLSRLYRQVR
ncbi:MAG TPA: TIGR04283 family arsenosugar biosynthesis glycosyltransferase [Thermoanaerobaculia bacterium]|nr:TIGR04283 family arsenosugar biosynthesis glycosyltransferase [Thermoanaerobaculia bacterium]